MAKTKISEFSSTPANNTDIDSINIAEGCAPSNINDAIRELMAQLKDFQTGAVGDSFNGPIGSSTASTGAFTNITASGTLGVTGVATLGAGAILNTPASVTLTNATGLPISTGVSGLGTGVATALAVNVGSAGAPVVNGGALGTPSSGTVTNLTGTASININGTVGATTPTTGAFTTLSASSSVTLSGGTANGVTYLNGSKVLTSGSALTFDGTNLGVGRTATSGFKVDIQGDGGLRLLDASALRQLTLTPANAADDPSIISASSAAGLSIRAANASGNIVFTANGTSEQMRLTSTGLGIGTSSPGNKLDVAGTGRFTSQNAASASGAGVEIYYVSGSNRGDVIVYDRGAAAFKELRLDGSSVGMWTGGTQRTWLDSSGNLGLGTAPSAWYTGNSAKAFEFGSAGNGILQYGSTTNITSYYLNNAYLNVSASFIYGQSGGGASYYRQNNGAHAWGIAASGTAGDPISFTQAMTLDASGNLGIGTTSPNIGGYGANSRVVTLQGVSGSYGIAELSSNSANSDGTFVGRLDFSSGGQAAGYVNIASIASVLSGSTSTKFGSTLQFYTRADNAGSGSPTERARITSGGFFKASNGGTYNNSSASYHELRVTTNTGDWTAFISHAAPTASNQYGVLINLAGDPNGTTNEFLFCNGNATLRASIRSNGGIANYQANDVNLSDRREKTNFAPAGEYLSKICAIPVQTFNYIDQNLEEDGGLTLGVVAQDVQAVAPELVMESNWADKDEEPKMRLSIYQTDLQYALMKCIQEQQAIIESLKARLDAANL